MPHSESQLIGDMVKESHNAIVRQMLPKPVVHTKNEKIIVPRPPLPPNITVKVSKARLAKKLGSLSATNSSESIPQCNDGKGYQTPKTSTIDASTKTAPKIIEEKCVAKLVVAEKCIESDKKSPVPVLVHSCDNNNNNTLMPPLSRNSSVQSIDSLSSFRSISPSMSLHSSIGSFNSRQSLSGSVTPRRIYPQAYKPGRTLDPNDLKQLDDASTIFDGKMSFVLGCKRQPVRQEFRSSPAHLSDTENASRYLSNQISDFLKRTDHIADEWKHRGKSSSRNSISRQSCDMLDDELSKRLGRSRSVTNIMIKGYQLAQSMPPTERSSSVCRDRCGSVFSVRTDKDDDDDCTIIDDEDDEVTCHL